MLLDDAIGGNTNRGKAVKSSKFIKGTLDDLGVLIAEDICKWDPVLQAVWLGHFWNMVEGKLYVTDKMTGLIFVCLVWLFMSQSTAMVMLRRSVHLITIQISTGPKLLIFWSMDSHV